MEIDAKQRKEYIVLQAVTLISEKGINNVSTKEIAKRLNISEGLIFKLFPKKSDIILAVLEHLSIYDKDMYITALDKNDNAYDAICFYINSFMIYYENYPEITAVYMAYDSLRGDPLVEQKASSIFQNRIYYLSQLLEKARAESDTWGTFPSEDFAIMILSTIRGMCLKWRLENYGFLLRERTMAAILRILEGLKPVS
jgi:AcrR family transcriptional regulator